MTRKDCWAFISIRKKVNLKATNMEKGQKSENSVRKT